MILTSLIIIMVMFSIYGWLSSIELSVSLARLFDKRLPGKRIDKLFTPLWEVTNVFLVFGFTGLAVLFNNGLPTLARAVMSTLVVGLVSLIVRALTVLCLYYLPTVRWRKLIELIFVLTSYVVPLSFTAAGVYLLTGQIFYQTVSGLGLIFATFVGLTALAFTFINFVENANRSSMAMLARNSNLFLAIVVGLVLPITFGHDAWQLLGTPVTVLASLAAAGVSLQVLLAWRKNEWRIWWYWSAVALLAPILLELANLPFFIHGQFTLSAAFGASAYGWVAIIGLGIIFPIMALGFGLLFWLLASDKLA